MRLGPLVIVFAKRRSNRPRRMAEPDALLDALAELATILKGLPWMIVSGVAIPLTLGRFYRRHRDLDIGVPVERFEVVQRAMHGAGYLTLTRLCMLGLGRRRKVEVYLRCGAGGWLARVRPRNLRFCLAPGGAPGSGACGFRAWIDVYLYRETALTLEILDGRTRMPKRVPIIGATIEAPGGALVRIVHLHYVNEVKARLRCKTHRLDRQVMARGIDAAVLEFEEWASDRGRPVGLLDAGRAAPRRCPPQPVPEPLAIGPVAGSTSARSKT